MGSKNDLEHRAGLSVPVKPGHRDHWQTVMSRGVHPEPGSSRSGPGAVDGVAVQGPGAGPLSRVSPDAGPCAHQGGRTRRAEGPLGLRLQLSGGPALSLWSLSGTTVWGRTLTLDRKEAEAAALGLGLGPRSWFYGSTVSLRETINQAANGPPAGRGPWTPRGVGVQPRACLPGDGRGLEGDEGSWKPTPA